MLNDLNSAVHRVSGAALGFARRLVWWCYRIVDTYCLTVANARDPFAVGQVLTYVFMFLFRT